jgi:hypothetical protein
VLLGGGKVRLSENCIVVYEAKTTTVMQGPGARLGGDAEFYGSCHERV